MIVPDANLLIYAYDADSRFHPAAREWLRGLLISPASVGLAWVAILGFVRIMTNPRICLHPLPVAEAISVVRSWLDRPNVQVIHPGGRHPKLFFQYLEELGTAGNLTTDAHLAALAVEYQAELHTSDTDFARFSGLRWINPLQ